MTFPKVKFEPTFTIGNVITLLLLLVTAVSGFYDMRGSVREVAQETAAVRKEAVMMIAAVQKETAQAAMSVQREAAQTATSVQKELEARIELERQLTVSSLKQQDLRIESAKNEKATQIQLHEQRIKVMEQALIELAQFTRATGQLQTEIKNLSENVKELKEEVRALRNTK